MIISGGENIFSAEVENALGSHPAILDCAVIGVPDPRWGERVHAIVRLREGMVADAVALILHCQTALARYKCPSSVEFRTEAFPMWDASPILKRDVRAPYGRQDKHRSPAIHSPPPQVRQGPH